MAGPAELRVVVTGDVIPTQPLGPDEALPAGVRAALAELRAADVAFGNLEAPLTDRGAPCDKPVCFRAAPALAADV
ncbi:MAG TPA: CapA family protein, partial [Conexibacter sp.]|nr:CapA family protein [Conexibacter sp.]